MKRECMQQYDVSCIKRKKGVLGAYVLTYVLDGFVGIRRLFVFLYPFP